MKPLSEERAEARRIKPRGPLTGRFSDPSRKAWLRWCCILLGCIAATILAVAIVYKLVTLPPSAPSRDAADGAFSLSSFSSQIASGSDARRGIHYDRYSRLRVLGVEIGEVVT